MYLENGRAYPETDDERWALETDDERWHPYEMIPDATGGYDPFALAALFRVVAHDRSIHGHGSSHSRSTPDDDVTNLRRYGILQNEVEAIHSIFEKGQ